jgi:hypothetical protein
MKGRRRHDAHRITTNNTTHRTDTRKAADHPHATPRTTPPRQPRDLLLVSRVQRTHHPQQRTPVPVLRRTHHATRAACSMTQHMDALAKGNTVRLERARIKRKLKDMSRADAWDQAAEYISEPPAALKGVLVHDFLQWQHRYGASLATRFINDVNRRQGNRGLPISQWKQIGGLSLRQQLVVASAMRAKAEDLRDEEQAA